MSFDVLLILIPLLLAAFYLFFKWIKTNPKYFRIFKKEIRKEKAIILDELNDAEDFIKEEFKKAENSIEEAKEIVFNAFYKTTSKISLYSKRFLTFLLHFFVLFTKKVRDLSDFVYEKSRDNFLKTASKEKGTVIFFWKHLKQYRREIDEEKKEN